VRRFSLVLPILLVFTGCVSLSPQEAAVRVTSNPEVVRGCRFLGNVRDTATKLAHGSPATAVEDMLKKETAALGGNTVLVATITSTGKGTTESGEAYSCPEGK
jgi:Domain of unknown function (DUF4156)